MAKDSVGAVKAGELLSGQVKLKIRQNASVAEWICNKMLSGGHVAFEKELRTVAVYFA